ncbi:MAG: PilZ domain-containing protein [Terriglobales bacterium]
MFVWQLRCDKREDSVKKGATPLNRPRMKLERRSWSRLPLPIPLFVRSRDSKGKDLLEFATALNISAGGALVALHGALRPAAQVSLEIPSAPLPTSAPVRKNSRHLRAKVVRVTHGDGFNLVGLKFIQPLLPSDGPRRTSTRRKVTSSV